MNNDFGLSSDSIQINRQLRLFHNEDLKVIYSGNVELLEYAWNWTEFWLRGLLENDHLYNIKRDGRNIKTDLTKTHCFEGIRMELSRDHVPCCIFRY
jgi:hypothetical protein